MISPRTVLKVPGKTPARILIIEDSKPVREEIKKALTAASDLAPTFLEAENGLDGFRALMDQAVDLVLCDLVMPEMDGFKFLTMRASRPELAEIPVLMLTAVGGAEQKVRLLEAGAGDYIVKPFHPGELRARAVVHLRRKLLEDELRGKNALLLELSTTDGLTKIHNRRHFLEAAHAEVERSRRLGLAVTVMLFDLDRFKGINDGYGHQVGDEVLVRLCGVVRQVLREYDIFGRYGGDEFVVLFPQTDMEAALLVAGRIADAVHRLRLPELKGEPLSISGGVAGRGSGGLTIEELIRRADDALYRAKVQGRDRIIGA